MAQQELERQQQQQRLEQIAPANFYGHPVVRQQVEIEWPSQGEQLVFRGEE